MGIVSSISEFLAASKRIFTISKKPDRQEFVAMLKATAIGTLVIAVIGFIVYLVFALTGIGK